MGPSPKFKKKFRSKPGRGRQQRKSHPPRGDNISKPQRNRGGMSTPMPPGYVFVRKGNAYLTSGCKKQSDHVGKPYYTVADGKTIQGIRVHHSVLSQVRSEHEATAAQRARNVAKNDDRLAAKFESAVIACFPNVPRQNLPQIVAQAMQKGNRRVGRTETLPIESKVTLAVRAHVRHVMTDYDQLLRQRRASRDDARRLVEEKIRATMREWGYKRPEKARAKKPAQDRGRDVRYRNYVKRQNSISSDEQNAKGSLPEDKSKKRRKKKKKKRSDPTKGNARGSSRNEPAIQRNVRVTTRSAASAARESKQYAASPRESPAPSALDLDDDDDDDDDDDGFIEDNELDWSASDNSYESQDDDESDEYSDDYGMGDESEDDFDLE